MPANNLQPAVSSESSYSLNLKLLNFLAGLFAAALAFVFFWLLDRMDDQRDAALVEITELKQAGTRLELRIDGQTARIDQLTKESESLKEPAEVAQ